MLSEVRLTGEMDGFALARRLRQTHPQIDVILNSGVEGMAEKPKDLCEDRPLKKPYHAKEVAARINILLERRRSSQRAK